MITILFDFTGVEEIRRHDGEAKPILRVPLVLRPARSVVLQSVVNTLFSSKLLMSLALNVIFIVT